MKARRILTLLAALLLLAVSLPCAAENQELFTDTSFQGNISIEALDAIIDKYELYDGWYWTTQSRVSQNFHGQSDKPGWTDTAVNVFRRNGYIKGWYGCRWGKTEVNPEKPNDAGSGECYGFANFVGYLLTGVRNPQRSWTAFPSVEKAGGLRVGDILRADYDKDGRRYQHSAVVYDVRGDQARFLQVSGGNYNMLRTRQGYCDGNLMYETSITALKQQRGMTVYRYGAEAIPDDAPKTEEAAPEAAEGVSEAAEGASEAAEGASEAAEDAAEATENIPAAEEIIPEPAENAG